MGNPPPRDPRGTAGGNAVELVGWVDGSHYEAGYAIPVSLVEHMHRARTDLAQGDDRASDLLVGRLYRTVRRVVRKRLRGLPNAECDAVDITHEALLKINRSLAQCRATNDHEAWSWIWTIVERTRVDYCRRELPELAHEVFRDEVARSLGIASWEDWRQALDDEPSSGEARLMRLVMECYEAMPEETMELLWERLHLGVSFPELATKYGATPGAIKRRCQRAVSTLRRQVMLLLGRHRGPGGSADSELHNALAQRIQRPARGSHRRDDAGPASPAGSAGPAGPAGR